MSTILIDPPPVRGTATFDPRATYHTVPNFTPLAKPMRERIERQFADPYKQAGDQEVWNYWYVPDTYNYLRTTPDKVFGKELVDAFMQQLTEFATTRLGMDDVTRPWLGMYIDNCGQQIHNDSRNGSVAYVYSLTRWDERKFSGGETMVFHQQDYFASGRFTDFGAGVSFYDLVPARFNQLLVFDDRMMHRVPTVRGVTDPRAARIVMHGHITAKRVIVRGPLQAPEHAQSDGVRRLVEIIQHTTQQQHGRMHGVATFALQVGPDGRTHDVRILVDRVLPLPAAGNADPEAIVATAREQFATLRFNPTAGASTVTVPLIFS